MIVAVTLLLGGACLGLFWLAQRLRRRISEGPHAKAPSRKADLGGSAALRDASDDPCSCCQAPDPATIHVVISAGPLAVPPPEMLELWHRRTRLAATLPPALRTPGFVCAMAEAERRFDQRLGLWHAAYGRRAVGAS